MSAEFEKIVLEKLNKIETTLDLHSKNFDRIEERFAKQDERFAKQDERFAMQDKKFAEQDARFAKQDDRMDRIEKIAIENSKKIDAILETLKTHSNMFIQFEYDFNLKFQALLDANASKTDKLAMHDDVLLQHSSKLLNHDIRLISLEEEQERYSN